jgi:RimJ/RimL family protein N-acetyltransferase
MKDKPDPLKDSDFTDFACPYCGNPVSFPKEDTGALKQCPNCLESMIVPKPGLSAERICFPIQTPRLLIRRLRTQDQQDFFALLSNEDLLRYTTWEPYGEEEIREWLAHDKQLSFPHRDKEAYFALQSAESGRTIGLVFFCFPYEEDFDTAEFLVLIDPKWQRQGLAAEAARGLFAYAFNGLRVHRIMAFCDSRNVAARRMFLKTGMRQESHCLKDHFLKGEWVDTVGFGLLFEEFDNWSKS